MWQIAMAVHGSSVLLCGHEFIVCFLVHQPVELGRILYSHFQNPRFQRRIVEKAGIIHEFIVDLEYFGIDGHEEVGSRLAALHCAEVFAGSRRRLVPAAVVKKRFYVPKYKK